MLTVSSDVEMFNRTLREYIAVTGKTPAEAVFKQGVKVGWELRKRLLELKPGKGAIRAQLLSQLKQGIGVRVRQSVYESLKKKAETSGRFARGIGAYTRLSDKAIAGGVDKKGRNLQAIAVAREIALRERGRGYSGFAVRPKIPSMKAIGKITSSASDNWKLFGRYQQYLTSAGLKATPGSGTFTYTWGGLDATVPTDIGTAMQKPQQQAALRDSLREVDRDMAQFIREEYRRYGRQILKTL